MAKLGAITAKLVADTKEFNAKMEGAGKKVDSVAGDSVSSVSKVGGALSAVGVAAAAAAAAIGTAFIIVTKEGIGVAAQLESAEQGFKALLGSADEAGAVMDRIKKEAARTPFEMTGLTAGVQALTAITKDGDRAVDILMDVGKAVAISGKGSAELDRVIYNLQQIAASGKVTAMDIRQFQTAIPIFNDIIAANGVTVEALQNSENASELLFESFKKAGMEGGIAAEGFSSQAGTWNQLVSNMKDTWQIFAADFVTKLGIFDIAKEALELGMELLDKYGDKLIDWLIPALGEAKVWFEDTWKTIKEYWELYGQPIFDLVVSLIENTIVPAWEYLKEQIENALKESGMEMEDFKKVLKIVALVLGGIVLGSVMAVIAILGGLMFAVGKVIEWNSKLQKKMKEDWQRIKDTIQWHVDKIKGIFNAGSFREGLLRALKYPFEAFWRWISGLFDRIRQKIQDALDLTKRHSPSVIDVLTNGIDKAEQELQGLSDMRITPMANLMGEGISGASGGISLSINMAGANISSQEVAQEYAERIGDAIVGKLRTNRRSYV